MSDNKKMMNWYELENFYNKNQEFVLAEKFKIKIHDFCKTRKRCKGCPYYINKIIPEYDGYWRCIFANSPASWYESEE